MMKTSLKLILLGLLAFALSGCGVVLLGAGAVGGYAVAQHYADKNHQH